MTVRAEGHGILAGMVNKAVSGTRMSTVTKTKVVAAPLSDALFVIPDGWGRGKKWPSAADRRPFFSDVYPGRSNLFPPVGRCTPVRRI